jgi:hypothetical protein
VGFFSASSAAEDIMALLGTWYWEEGGEWAIHACCKHKKEGRVRGKEFVHSAGSASRTPAAERVAPKNKETRGILGLGEGGGTYRVS